MNNRVINNEEIRGHNAYRVLRADGSRRGNRVTPLKAR